MASVDQRIVEMKFDNAAFQKGVSSTLSALESLKKGLDLKGAGKGLDAVADASKRFSLSGITDGLKSAMGGFSALGVMAATTLATITHQAITAGAQLVKSLTVAPIMDGFREYELKMGSIQTIMANTARHGTSLETVNSELNKLNKYADQTIYNFAEMTKNASLFTNSGMKIEDATTVIKGFSNSAAASGTNAAGAAGAAYQLSQALSAGTIRLMDWRSLTNVGMGGENMKEGIITIAKAMGTLKEGSDTAQRAMTDFNGSLEDKWLSADVMSTYLKAMSGDMDDAALAALGLSAAQIKTIQAQAQMGLEAATKVRTMTQLMSTLKEAVASGWTDTFEIVFGNFTEATELFTGVSDVIGGMLAKSADARNKLLGDWKEMGGRAVLLNGLKNGFEALTRVVGPIRDAFREVFPPMTAERLYQITDAFRDFMAKLRIGEEAMNNLKSTFMGVFSIFKIALSIIGGVTKAIFALFTTAGESAGGLLAITGLVGDFITNIQKFLSYTGLIEKFFAVLVSPLLILKPLVALVSDLVVAFAALASGDISGFTSQFKGAFESLGRSITGVKDTIAGMIGNLGASFELLGRFFSVFADRANASGNAVLGGFANALATVSNFLSRFATDARGAINELISTFQKAASSGQNFFAALGGAGLSGIMSLIDNLSQKFKSLRENMDFSGVFSQFNSGASTMSTGGVAVLSGSFNVVSTILSGIKSLFSGISGAVGPLLGELSAFFTMLVQKFREYVSTFDGQDLVAVINTGFLIALYIAIRRFVSNLRGLVGDLSEMIGNISGVFEQLTNTLKTMQQNIRANIILKIAIAVGILVAAVVLLSKIDSQALAKALVALSALFIQLGIMLGVIQKMDPKSFTSSAAGMILLAVAIRILAGAIQTLGEMDPQVLIQGGIALGVLMAAVAGMMTVISGMKGLVLAATGMLILSAALLALTGAILVYSKIPFSTLVDGLVGMAAALVIIGLAVRSIPMSLPLTAAGLVILAGAMVILTGVIAALGSLPLETVAQGLVAMGVAVGILAIAALAMRTALPGAAAMMVMAAAIAVLVPALALLGALPMEVIIKGMLGLAAVLGIFVIAMYALTPVIVTLAIFSSALMTLGLAMLAAGAGFALFVGALGLLTVVGAAGFGVLILGIQGLLNLLPLMAQQAGYAVIAFAKVIGDAAPKVAEAAGKVLMAFVNEIAKRVPQIADAGLRMIIGLLEAIKSRIGRITNLVIDIVTIFLTTLTGRLPSIIQSGVDFILSFVEGLAKAIRGEKKRTGEAGSDLALALIEGIISGLKAFGKNVWPKIVEVAKGMLDAFKSFLGINSPSTVFAGLGGDIVMGIINGIGKKVGELAGKAKEMAAKAISSAKEGFTDAATAGALFIAKLVVGIGDKVSELSGKAKEVVRKAIQTAKDNIGNAADVGKAIVEGIARGISNGLSIVKDAASKLAKGALDSAKSFLGIKSPSKEFEKIGEFISEGMAQGIDKSSGNVNSALEHITGQLSSTMESAGQDVKSLTETLASLEAAQERDTLAIWKTTNALNMAKAELKATKAAHTTLTTELVDEREQLKRLGSEHDSLTKKLENANQVLTDAKKTRDDYNASLKTKYSDVPDFDGKTNLTQYMHKLAAQVKDTNTFTTAVQKLRTLGLNDKVYKEILDKGIEALPFVNQLVDGGAAAVAEINQLSSQLVISAGTLADQGSTALYQAGVDTAQALADGIASQLNAVKSEMDRLIEVLRVALEEKLKLDAELAKPAPRPKREKSEEEKKGNRRRGIGPGKYVDDVRRDSTPVKTGGTVAKGPGRKRRNLSPRVTSESAISASTGYRTSRETDVAGQIAASRGATFIQNNYSPKALSSAEIYRKTSSQLSRARS